MIITKKEIRKELYLRFRGDPEWEEKMEGVYKWITNAPFWQWDDRLWCARENGYDIAYSNDAYTIITHKHHR